jgi:hypothetical protein
MSSGRWPWPDVAIGLILGSLLVAAGLWFDSEVHEVREARRAARTALVTAIQVERRSAEDRRKFAAWAARTFVANCERNHGTYDADRKSCSLPDGQVFQYDAPFP